MKQPFMPQQSLLALWIKTKPTARLWLGSFLVLFLGIIGLTSNLLAGLNMPWPLTALVAAVGWGRSGLALSPILPLVLFGFVQDIISIAPLGCYPLIYLVVFAASGGLSQIFDTERNPNLAQILPVIALLTGFLLLWLVASLSSGHLATVGPLFSAFIMTVLAYLLLSGVFDLGRSSIYASGEI